MNGTLVPVPLVDAIVEGAKLGAPAQVLVQQCFGLPTLAVLRYPVDRWPVNVPDLGSAVRVDVGRQPLFDGQVSAVEREVTANGAMTLTIKAFDALEALRRQHHTRAHIDVDLGDLAKEFLAGSAIVVEAEPGPRWSWLIQTGQSDFDFLAEVATRSGVSLFLNGKRLSLRRTTTEAPIPLHVGRNLIRGRVEKRYSPTGVEASGWNPASAATIRAGHGDILLPGLIVEHERQLNGRVEAVRRWDDATTTLLTGVAEGDPRLVPGATVIVPGLGETAPFVLTRVRHEIDSGGGYLSEISSEPVDPPALTSGPILTLGVVARVDDPEQRGRVRLTLPAHDAVETDWLPVLVAGAGAGRGLHLTPVIGDRVLVIGDRFHLGQAIVLGSLFGTDRAPGTAGRWSWQTAGRQRIELDDDRQTIRIEIASGSFLELAPDKVALQSRADLEIAAPGHSITITADAVDFVRG